MVPKGRLELPRALAHYALNVARLPIPPLRHAIQARGSPSILKAWKTCQAAANSSMRAPIEMRSRTVRVGAAPLIAVPWRFTKTVR